jgi:phenylpyruvate tautomerase PptA (4-oxalocrotonate tautomerase family)
MPVLEVSALPQPGVDTVAAMRALCRDVAAVLGGEPRETWATWHTVDYVEGDDAREAQPQATHPPIVQIRIGAGRPPELVRRVHAQVVESLARELGIDPENVFAIVDELSPERLGG